MKKLMFAVLALTLSACASTPTPVFNHAGKYALYATINDYSGKFKIESFSNKSGNVDFNNIEYQGKTHTIDCGRSCTDKPPMFFRTRTVFPKHELGGGLGQGFNTSVRNELQEFSDSKFKLAVEEALINSNINRNELVARYDAYVDARNKQVDFFTLPPEKFTELINGK